MMVDHGWQWGPCFMVRPQTWESLVILVIIVSWKSVDLIDKLKLRRLPHPLDTNKSSTRWKGPKATHKPPSMAIQRERIVKLPTDGHGYCFDQHWLIKYTNDTGRYDHCHPWIAWCAGWTSGYPGLISSGYCNHTPEIASREESHEFGEFGKLQIDQ